MRLKSDADSRAQDLTPLIGSPGYPPVRDAIPNPTHFSLAALQYLDYAPRLITQNVDGLHIKASPFPPIETRKRILELHGSLHVRTYLTLLQQVQS